MKNFLKGKKMMAAGLAAAFIALTGLTACGGGGNGGNGAPKNCANGVVGMETLDAQLLFTGNRGKSSITKLTRTKR